MEASNGADSMQQSNHPAIKTRFHYTAAMERR